MPEYEFQADDGEVISEFFHIAECPDLGTAIRRNGKDYKRIVSVPQLDADLHNKVHHSEYISRSLPRNLEGVECVKEGPHKGRAIIKSQKQEREVCARFGLKRD